MATGLDVWQQVLINLLGAFVGACAGFLFAWALQGEVRRHERQRRETEGRFIRDSLTANITYNLSVLDPAFFSGNRQYRHLSVMKLHTELWPTLRARFAETGFDLQAVADFALLHRYLQQMQAADAEWDRWQPHSLGAANIMDSVMDTQWREFHRMGRQLVHQFGVEAQKSAYPVIA